MLNVKIGVVTVTYNSASVLLPFLECTFRQTHGDFVLYAIDNASRDETVQLLRGCIDKRLRVIVNEHNFGVAAANNQGIEAALHDGCDSVLLLNNDTEFPPDLFELLLEGLHREQVGMVCPKMLYHDAPDHIWAAGGTFQPLFAYRIVHFGEGKPDTSEYNREKFVTYVPTCCVLIDADVFTRIGLMDEAYFVYMDDVDFMYRAWRAGVKLLYLPTAKLTHKVGGLTGGSGSPFAYRYCTRNRVYFLFKQFGALVALPVLIAYQLHFVLSLLTGRYGFTTYRIKQKAVLEGILLWIRTPTTIHR